MVHASSSARGLQPAALTVQPTGASASVSASGAANWDRTQAADGARGSFAALLEQQAARATPESGTPGAAAEQRLQDSRREARRMADQASARREAQTAAPPAVRSDPALSPSARSDAAMRAVATAPAPRASNAPTARAARPDDSPAAKAARDGRPAPAGRAERASADAESETAAEGPQGDESTRTDAEASARAAAQQAAAADAAADAQARRVAGADVSAELAPWLAAWSGRAGLGRTADGEAGEAGRGGDGATAGMAAAVEGDRRSAADLGRLTGEGRDGAALDLARLAGSGLAAADSRGHHGASPGGSGDGWGDGADRGLAGLAAAGAGAASAEPATGATGFAQALSSHLAHGAQGTASSGLLQASVPEPVSSPAFPAALGEQVRVLVLKAQDDAAVQEARLDLNPVEMGPITVRIAVEEGGQAQVHFEAASADTRRALQDSLPALADALASSGLQLAGGGVSEQGGQTGNRGDGSGDGSAGSRLAGVSGRGRDAGAADAAADPLASRTVRALRGRGNLDLYA